MVMEEMAPVTNLTSVSPVMPPAVALTTALPVIFELLRLTVAIPAEVVAVAAERVPAVVVKLTIVPSAMLLPLSSLTRARIWVWAVPSAGMLSAPAVTSTEPTIAVIRMILALADVPFGALALRVSVPGVCDAV